MLFIDRTGRLCYRTRLVRNVSAAVRFARLIAANSRFESPEVVKSTQSLSDAWFVTYRPSNPDRQSAMTERMQSERIQRCLSEMDAYAWSSGGADGGLYCRTKSGSEYYVTATGCSCADFNERCSEIGVWCKHIVARSLRASEPTEEYDSDPFADAEVSR